MAGEIRVKSVQSMRYSVVAQYFLNQFIVSIRQQIYKTDLPMGVYTAEFIWTSKKRTHP